MISKLVYEMDYESTYNQILIAQNYYNFFNTFVLLFYNIVQLHLSSI